MYVDNKAAGSGMRCHFVIGCLNLQNQLQLGARQILAADSWVATGQQVSWLRSLSDAWTDRREADFGSATAGVDAEGDGKKAWD